MKLKSILKTLPLSALESIHRFWEFNDPKSNGNGSDAHMGLSDFLYPRLQLRHSFQHAFEKLSKDEKDLVYFLAIHGGDLEESEVLSRCCEGDESRLQDLMLRLMERGFAFYDTMSLEDEAVRMIGLPEPYLRFVDLPSYWEGYLGSFLKDLSTPRLKSIANQGLKLKIETSKKHLLIWQIRRALTNQEFLRRHVENLLPEQRDILDSMLEKRGISVYRDLIDQSFLRRYDHQRADHIQTLLNSSGLMFTAVEGDNMQNNLLMVPRDVAFIIQSNFHPDHRSLRELDTVSMSLEESTQQLILDNSGHLLRDMVVLMAMVRNHPPRVLSNGGIGKNDLKKILPSLSAHKTLKYVRFLALFLERKRMLLPAADYWTVNEGFENWIADAREVYREMYTFWLETTAWNEEYPDGDTFHAEPPPSNLIHAAELRRIALENLTSIPKGTWVDFDGFAEGIIPQIELNLPARNPNGEFPMLRHNHLALESVVAESLYWLGVLTIGVSKAAMLGEIGSRSNEALDPLIRQGIRGRGRQANDYAFTFRPTALGQKILAAGATDPARLFGARGAGRIDFEMNSQQFTVQPNLEILAPPDLSLPSLYQLCRFCEVISLDIMSTLALTKLSLREAMDRGVDRDSIIAFLDENSSIAVPATVKQLIHECSSRQGQISMGYAGGYIFTDDRATLEELRLHRRLRDSVKETVGDNLILLTPRTDLGRLARELRKSGFMPRVDSENVHSTADGDFLIRLAPKELYDLLGILKFVNAMEDELGQTLTEERARPLLERLQPDPSGVPNFSDYPETICKSFIRRYHAARKKQIDEVAGRYKRQLARLLTTGSSLERSVAYSGTNPATTPEEIRQMIQFCIDHETRLDISYLSPKGAAVRDSIEPEALNGDKIYAFSEDHDGHAMFSLSSIRKAKLP